MMLLQQELREPAIYNSIVMAIAGGGASRLNKPEIESGDGDIVAETEVFGEKSLSYIGKPPFETICLQYLRRANRSNSLPFTATSFGTWRGVDPKSKAQTVLT